MKSMRQKRTEALARTEEALRRAKIVVEVCKRDLPIAVSEKNESAQTAILLDLRDWEKRVSRNTTTIENLKKKLGVS